MPRSTFVPLFLIPFLLPLAVRAAAQEAVVTVPVADVWSRPLNTGEKPSDDLRETQVLFGEKLLVHDSSGPWVRVEAIEQPEFTHHNRWEGYPGWTLSKWLENDTQSMKPNAVIVGSPWWFNRMDKIAMALPLGARPHFVRWTGVDFNVVRRWPSTFSPTGETVVSTARLLEGAPYVWGGLSSPPEDPGDGHLPGSFGVDCSGLVHLAYRVNGITIPRDAHDQWMKSAKIKRADLKPADLVFSAKAGDPNRVTHVAIYAGGGNLLEAPQSGMTVRKITFKEKFGKDLRDVETGNKVGDRVIYFGRLFQP